MIKKTILLLCIIYISFISQSSFAQPALQFQKSLGGSTSDYSTSVEQINDGGYILSGFSYSNDGDVTGSHGNSDYWIVRLNSAFDIVWQKSLGGTGPDNGYTIQQTPDGGFIVVGESNSSDGDVTGNHGNYDVWVVKLTASGVIDWQKSYGGTGSDNGWYLDQTSDNGFIITGSTNTSNNGDVIGNQGGNDAWVIKLDNAGNLEWQKCLGGSSNDYGSCTRQTADGGFIFVGYTGSTTGQGLGNHGGNDAFVVKLDSNGNIVWNKCYGGTGADYGYSIVETSTGDYVVSSETNSTNGDITNNNGGYDMWIIKIDSAGNLIWSNTYGGSSTDENWNTPIIETSDGGYINAGYSNSSDGDVTGNYGSADYWIFKINSTGNLEWQKSLGGSSSDYAYALCTTIDGGYVVAGESPSTDYDITFNHGGSDYWLAYLNDKPYSLYYNSATCSYSCDGWISVTPFGVGPFTYDWSPGMPDGDGTDSIYNLCPGTYYLALTDDNLSTTYYDTIVIGPDEYLPNENITHITCNGLNNGSITTNATGGNMPYSYSWNVGGTNSSVTSLDTGLVILTTTDNNSCIYVDSFYVNEPNVLTATSVVTPINCFGNANGSVAITPQGGTAPYTFAWSNGSTSQNISNLSPNVYQLTITDANGCTYTNSYTITQPSALSFNVTNINTTCGSATGAAIVGVSGGVSPYSYLWTNGDVSNMADSLAAGLYQVTITDANGCTIIGNSTISDNNGPVITLDSLINVSCYGGSDGAIYLTATGGTPPLDVYWLNGDHDLDQTGLPAGTQEVNVVDANGCTTTKQYTINQPDSLLWNATVTNATCTNSNGQIVINPSGGTSPYSVLWSTSSTSFVVGSLGFGIYSVTSTDANGCVDSTSFIVSENGAPIITVDSLVNPSCIGGLGSIYTTISGPGAPYNLFWSNSATTDDITGLSGGMYVLQAIGSTGCTSLEIVELDLNRPDNAPICIVTVDSTYGFNTITWEKTGLNNNIDYFKILRESSTLGVYYTVGTVPFDSLSFYIDSASNPTIKSYRYKLVSVDTCGIESIASANHKTIHLSANLGVGGVVNLIWDHYEGYTYPTYYIERYHSSTGWIIIDSVSSSANSFTDLTPPAGFIQYAVNNKAPYSCDPTRAGVNTSRSNIKNQSSAAPTNIYELDEKLFSMSPNPTNQFVTIECKSHNKLQYELTVYDITGAMLNVNKVNENTLDVSVLSNGTYFIKIEINGSFIHKKLQVIR